MDYYEIPATKDPRWVSLSKSLLEYVSTHGGVTIDDVVEWGIVRRRSCNLTKNMLAWLSFNGLVVYDEEVRKWRLAT